MPLRPLGLADILDGSVRVIRRHPGAMLGPSAVFAVIRVAVTAGLELGAYRFLNTSELDLITTLVIGALLGTALTGLLTLVVTQDVLGARITTREVLTRVRGRAWTLLGLATVTTVLESVALLPMLVLGLWLWGLWAVAVPAMMVEGSTIGGALARSRLLVAGLWWRVWGIRALAFLLAGLLSLVLSAPFIVLAALVASRGLFVTGPPVAAVLIIAVGSVLASTLTAPIRAGVDALLYVDLRMRREGLDIVLRTQAGTAHSLALPTRTASAF